MTLLPHIQLLRPHQWVKNLFVFLPLFFNKGITDTDRLADVVLVFVAFCLIASSIYCFNDIYDREADRNHTKKKSRPVASGAVSVPAAYMMMALTAACSIAVCAFLRQPAFWHVAEILIGYYILNIAYCLWLKRIAIVDVFCIATGFVLRIYAGGIAADVALSKWIVLLTFLLALLLAFGKRRDDVLTYTLTGNLTRKNVANYSIDFINMLLATIASVTMMCYIMYTVSTEVIELHGTEYLYVTSIFVLAALIRYLQITIVEQRSGAPTEIVVRDRFMQCCMALWLISFALIIYV